MIYSLESFDAPLVRSSLGNAIASKISSSTDVVFSGEGGDELFAGYDYFLDLDSKKSMQRELLNSVNSLHNTALQRVDRLANAYSVNIKLPILDENLILRNKEELYYYKTFKTFYPDLEIENVLSLTQDFN